MRGPAVLMEEPMLEKEERKEASLAATRQAGTAGNGKTKASAPEERIVRGRPLTLKIRREAVPRAPTRIRTLAIPKGNLEKEADQKEGGSPRSGGRAHDRNVEPRRMAQGINPSAAPS